MKNFITVIVLLALSACQAAGGSAPVSVASVDPTDSPSTPQTTPSAPVTPPVVVTGPTAPPAQSPANPYPNLFCYSNAGIQCTGGPLGTDTLTLDLLGMFEAGDPRYSVYATGVTNNLIATHTTTCSQQNAAGCYQQSTCVEVLVTVLSSHQQFAEQLCGNNVSNSNELVDQ